MQIDTKKDNVNINSTQPIGEVKSKPTEQTSLQQPQPSHQPSHQSQPAFTSQHLRQFKELREKKERDSLTPAEETLFKGLAIQLQKLHHAQQQQQLEQSRRGIDPSRPTRNITFKDVSFNQRIVKPEITTRWEITKKKESSYCSTTTC